MPRPNKPLTVLFVPTTQGGVGRVTSLLAQGLHTRGYRVEVWAVSDGEHADILREQLPVRIVGSGTKGVFRALPHLIKLLRDHRPSAVLSASFHANCVAVLAKIYARVPCSLYLAEHIALHAALKTLTPLRRHVLTTCIRILYPFAQGLIAVSDEARFSLSRVSGIKPERITTIYNPVITDELFAQSNDPVSHPFLSSGDPVVLSVGRLSKQKDYTTLIEALARVRTSIPARLILVGEGEERESLETLVEQLDLKEVVAFIGHITNPYPYFRASNLFVLSSLFEGLPTVLIEAIGLSMNIVSTDCPSGPREILVDGAYGRLVPVGDSHTLAKAIQEALANPISYDASEAAARFHADVATQKYIRTCGLTAEKFTGEE